MSLWRHITRGLRVLANRKAADQDLADEVETYFEQAVAALIARGLTVEEARRTARLEFGGTTAVREEVRSYGWENALSTLFSDVRYAVRRLSAKPGFAFVSVFTLAVGIGANVAIFSVIEAVLLKPLPYPHPEQLISLIHTAPGVDIKTLDMSASLYFTYLEEGRAFQDISLWSNSSSSVTGIAEPEEVNVLMVTNRLLPILDVQPALGRRFARSNDDPKSPPTVMLSNGYWHLRFGASPAVLGRRILVDGIANEVIGVLPSSFQFMDQKFSLLMPLRFDRAHIHLINFGYHGVARLKPGVTIAQAGADIARMIPLAPAKFPPNPGYRSNAFADARIGPDLRSLKDDLVGETGNMLWVLMSTVGIVLLIACANVANLSLVRADGRHQEIAVRAALGAGWGRIARELLLESLLLSVAGSVLGLAFAYAALRLLRGAEITDLPRAASVGIDSWTLAFTLALSLFSGLGFGLIPVLKYARPQQREALPSGGPSLSESKDRHPTRNILVVVQVTLAAVLLVGSGLMMRTFQALHHVDPGFSRAHDVQTISISIPEAQAKEPQRVLRAEEEIVRSIQRLPGVSSVAITNTLPMTGGSSDLVYAQDRVYRAGTLPPIRRYKYVSPGYVAAIGSRLIAGRELTWTETYNQAPVALVSENLARELWQSPNAALGKRIRSTLKDDWHEVVGVVTDLRDTGVEQKAPSIVYWPLLQKNFNGREAMVQRLIAFLIRTPRAGSTALGNEIRQAVWKVNPNLPVANVRTLYSIYDESLARTSFALVLLVISGVMALLLGVVGIYGVISYSVSQRTREIGIRLALGAPLQGLTRMFVRRGLTLSAIGAACGLLAAFALTRLIKSLLFAVSPADPLTYVAVAGGLIFAAAAASYLPARKATTVDPIDALRAE